MVIKVVRREFLDDGFIMSPKNDFVFKLLFGDEKNKDLLIELLNSILMINLKNVSL